LQHAVPGVHYAHEFRVPELWRSCAEEANLSLSSAEVKNEWSYTSTPSIHGVYRAHPPPPQPSVPLMLKRPCMNWAYGTILL
jgi:hypothetical protein